MAERTYDLPSPQLVAVLIGWAVGFAVASAAQLVPSLWPVPISTLTFGASS
jgi:hypothetical protein